MTTAEEQPRRRSLVWPALGAVLVAAGAGAWLWADNASTEPEPVAAGPVATATVERGTIALTESWDGTLGHGTPFTVTSPTGGTLTRLPEQDATVERGGELYRVDERPVILLYGAVPMYRNVGPGDAGVDVKQLEANLAELGYGGFTPDDDYTGSTAEAVAAWQADIGAEQAGRVARGQVVFVPEASRVDALRAAVGQMAAPGTPVLDLTGTDQVISVEVEVDDRERFDVDAEVSILFSGGGETTGTVSAIAVVAAAPAGGGEPEGGTGDPESIARVEIAVTEPAPAELEGAPVEVVVAVEERADVLLVPVNALLALAEGGYGLELVAEDGSTSVVAVDTGLFADGKVEVRSAGIVEGAVVGVAGR